jgi:two-component system sensor histidine kinase QseC
VVSGADRAGRLVDQLLTLARLDAAQRGDLAPCFLRTLAAEAVAEAAPAALAQGVALELADGPEITVRGVPGLIAVLLRNLLDNAIRHGGAGVVRVAVGADDAAAVLAVTDCGPGIPEAERGRALERFHRLETAGAGGSGLGLSIVHRIAEIHRAVLTLSAGDDGKGLRVELRFPAAPAA